MLASLRERAEEAFDPSPELELGSLESSVPLCQQAAPLPARLPWVRAFRVADMLEI